ncbi:hypothetical protein BC567DRAFT_16855 [Phyllosticta citribraziliensis]
MAAKMANQPHHTRQLRSRSANLLPSPVPDRHPVAYHLFHGAARLTGNTRTKSASTTYPNLTYAPKGPPLDLSLPAPTFLHLPLSASPLTSALKSYQQQNCLIPARKSPKSNRTVSHTKSRPFLECQYRRSESNDLDAFHPMRCLVFFPSTSVTRLTQLVAPVHHRWEFWDPYRHQIF